MDNEIRKCPECGSKNLITDSKHAEIYCADCGIVIAENLVDLGPEWRAYDAEQASKSVRTGPIMSYRMYDKGLGTPTPRLAIQAKKLRWTSMGSSEKTLAFALVEIDRMTSELRLPNNIKEATSVLYRKAMKKNLIKGRSVEELTSAMLYIICRQYRVPRTLREIAEVSRSPLRKIRKSYSFILRELGIKLAPADPADFIPRFCSKLGLSEETRERAIEIIREDKGTGTAKGWGPVGMAASAIYIATILNGEYRSEREIAKVAGTTEITIRNRYKELEKRLRLKLNIDVLSSHPHRENGKVKTESSS